MMRLAFVSHPLAEPDVVGNIARCKRWLRWLAKEYPKLNCQAPYITDIEIGLTRDHVPEERELGLRRNLAVVERAHALVLCGGRVSAGMLRELQGAQLLGLEVIDLTSMGEEPPRVGSSR